MRRSLRRNERDGETGMISPERSLGAHYQMSPLKRGTIAIIDSQKACTAILSKNLEKEHYEVLSASYEDAPEQFIREHHPDMVFLDFRAEKSADFKVLKFLRAWENTGYIPALLISDREDELERMRTFEEGADDLIAAPRIPLIICEVDILLYLRSLIDLTGRYEQLFSELEDRASVPERTQIQKTAIFNYLRNSVKLISDNRLSLIRSNKEIDELTGDAIAVMEQNILSGDDIKRAKELLAYFSLELGLDKEQWNRLIVSVSEALSNIIKYAGSGRVSLLRRDKNIFLRIEDEGPGLPFKDMLRSIFIKKFRKQRIHQLGFPLMMELVDHISLYTGISGTTLLMEFRL